MSTFTSNNARAIQYQVTQQPGYSEDLEHTNELRSIERQSTRKQESSNPSTFWDEFATCCCCCLCLNCVNDSNSDGCCECSDCECSDCACSDCACNC